MTESLLTSHRRVIHYYRRGYDESPPVPESFTIAEQATDLRDVLRELDISRAHLLGHSIGASIAMQAAFDDPNLVASLILVEPTWVSRAELLATFSERMSPVFQAYAAGDTREAAHRMLQMIDGDAYHSSLDRALGQGWFEDAVAAFDVYMRTEVPSAVAWRLDEERAARFSSPVLVLTGGQTLDLFSSIALDTVEKFPSARHTTVEGVTHNVIAGAPTNAAARIRDFLQDFDPVTRP
jgi:3-oxoadipate enol-lactonase